MKNTNRNYHLFCMYCWFLICSVNFGCKKFLTIGPPATQLVSSSVFESDGTATAALTGIYGNMYGNYGFAGQLTTSVTLLSGLSSDELTNFSTGPIQIEFYKNALSPTNGNITSYLWGQTYQNIYDANAVIEGLEGSSHVSNSVKTQLIGEAKFIRAFCYFYLVNLFGDVPLITSTKYKDNATAAREKEAQVYIKIISDLKEAKTSLTPDYSVSKGERIRPNKAAASALLSRAYLYTGNWADAESEATSVISNSVLYKLGNNLNDIFLANSMEAIWQFQPVLPSYNTNEGNVFILNTTPAIVALSKQLLDCFGQGDLRRRNWVDSIRVGLNTYYFPHKYKVKTSTTLTEYSMVLRLAELYLIRGEARAHQNNIIEAQADLNMIRSRAGLPNTSANIQGNLLKALLNERQVELFTEWGHRWLDLKRTGIVDSVMSIVAVQKGSVWNPISKLYPIPQSEILNNHNLIQNSGY